jgi:hypothetical protein
VLRAMTAYNLKREAGEIDYPRPLNFQLIRLACVEVLFVE